ncbi:D-alanyl-D-alanine carboxypeptidase family protein [Corynebacterium liangguodongii]|uniref:D-alanyl-D-alanine carboxypeptidase n=1 Tax=Corynebacterium liangguodongii TaxID=2079535 RepID=A0A2S0WCI6_9CORY|nr:serine hydrolase [Corynebacterium liangguodongii]AWB83487.1 D-alanyl-D-alanine carboxypeptidase [Corynebacterium liangguodongii]PWC00424.1 D-alanyl-D-alanine carboxypeptidase [Corynebacterium liangguodongii]
MTPYRHLSACLACGLLAAGAAHAAAQEPTPHEGQDLAPATREAAPNTDSCPNATRPPEARTTSEAAAPDRIPPALPVSYTGPCGVSAPIGFRVDDSVLASAWLVADLDSGDVLAMKDPHGRYRPASVIKVLLALVVIDELPLDKKITVGEDSAAMEGSAAGIGAGGTYTVNDLLHGLLMASGNDAAHALAQELGGDEVALGKVNALARELGMEDTRATTYTGLDSAGMSSSAWDLALAYREAFANPTFANIVDTQSYPFPGFGDAEGFELWNDNKLYLNDPDGIGGKTGYTDDANHTFVGAVNHEGRRLVAVVLDTTVDKARAWEQAQALLHESYHLDPGVEVASLRREAPAPAASETPAAPDEEPAVLAAGPDREAFPWLEAAIFAGVLACAAVAVWLSRASARKARRRR